MDQIHCEILNHGNDRDMARALVGRLYRRQSYQRTEGGSDIADFLGQDSSITLGVYCGDVLFGTIGVVPDSPRGLPMDTSYREELRPFRERNKYIAEVVQFAIDREWYAASTGRSVPLFLPASLFAHVLAFALSRGIEYLCVTTIPEHGRMYRLIGFQQLGSGTKRYASVDTDAVAHVFYVPEWRTRGITAGILGAEIVRRMPPASFFDSAIGNQP